MADRVEMAAWEGKAIVPACSILDASRLGQAALLGAGATRVSSTIECTGMRRYRLKIVQLTGAGPTAVNALDLPFGPAAANTWERAVLAAAMVTATRSVFNFGEGTAVMTCFMGPFLGIELVNNGGNAATYEIELWMQS